MRHSILAVALLCTCVLPVPFSATAQPVADTVRAGRFDNGKMWTFEYPPVEYLAEAYDFRPDASWFERARLSALRLPNCSASFVSPNGLVATNHHCARSSITKVTRPGENLLEDGFFARSVDEERVVDGLYVDQLVAIRDVTAEVDAAAETAETDAERQEARRAAVEEIERRLTEEAGGEAAGYHVQVVSLYNGGRYSAYTFRRYDDVRLVAAPELQLGYFGGDWDNFTYPRYALDFAFFRVYENGRPLDSSGHYFPWSQEGVQEGDLVFVIGNPGATNRLETVAQLEFRRDVQVETLLQFINSRIAAIEAYLAEHPEDEETRNSLFSLRNAQKAYLGRRDALRDPFIMARRQDAEQQFLRALEADPDLQERYGGLVDQMADVQREKRAYAADYGAFVVLENPRFSSATLRRALAARRLLRAREAGVSGEALQDLKDKLLVVDDQPAGLDQRYLAAQLEDFQRFLGGTDLLNAILQGRTPDEAAEEIYAGTALATAERTAEALEEGTLSMDDPAIRIAEIIAERYADYQSAFAGLGAREDELGRQLGRARFEVYGTSVPPDATFSLRFTDGIVKGYPYNGTVAPAYTTFYGLYDHYYSYGPNSDWDLPERWLNPPPGFELATPMNFVSTSDTIGGNSGSPAVNRDLELVGLNFDRTIEGLSRDYIYLPDRGRNVMVDARAVLEALEDIYELDRIVVELRTGQLVASEAQVE